MNLVVLIAESIILIKPYTYTICPFVAGILLFKSMQDDTSYFSLKMGVFLMFLWWGEYFAYIIISPAYDGYMPMIDMYYFLIGGLAFAAGITAYWIWLREGQPWLDAKSVKLTKKSRLERNKKTDIREIEKFLPVAIEDYDPTKYFDLKKGIFIGLNEAKKPVYIDIQEFDESHILLSGRSRIGKGVAAQSVISQSIEKGDFNVVLDPKGDRYMPSVFFTACNKNHKPYLYINLNPSFGFQINPFVGASAEALENMLVSGFGLDEKGDIADHYRLSDREAARECAHWMSQNNNATLASAFNELGANWVEKAAGFHAYMREMADLKSINASDSVNLEELIPEGGCLYVQGDMSNSRILRAQRMILLRLMAIAKNRRMTADTKKVLVFADEFKCHISRPIVTTLGAAAGWGLHCILAFQSFSDLEDMPKDLDKNAVKGAVIENTAISISYGIKDAATADFVSDMTGEILVDDETRVVEKNSALAEVVDNKRTIRQTERNLYDRNSIMSLKKGTAILSIAGQLSQAVYISKIKVVETDAAKEIKERKGQQRVTAAELI